MSTTETQPKREAWHRALDLAMDEDACGLFIHLDSLPDAEVERLIEAAQYLDHWGQEVAECNEAFAAARPTGRTPE